MGWEVRNRAPNLAAALASRDQHPASSQAEQFIAGFIRHLAASHFGRVDHIDAVGALTPSLSLKFGSAAARRTPPLSSALTPPPPAGARRRNGSCARLGRSRGRAIEVRGMRPPAAIDEFRQPSRFPFRRPDNNVANRGGIMTSTRGSITSY